MTTERRFTQRRRRTASGTPTREGRCNLKSNSLKWLLLSGVAVLLVGSTVLAAEPYGNPEALASTEWLADHLDDPAVRVLAAADPRVPTHKDSYIAGHIPGAVYVNVIGELSDPASAVPMMILPPSEFEALMGRLGINSGTTVVVYDDTGGLWAARLWWALRYYGHNSVKLLNGGVGKWIAEGRSLETEEIAPAPTTFKACVVPSLRATIEDVTAAIGDPESVIVSALPPPMHAAGHIPSSCNLPAPGNLDPETGQILEMEALTQLWSSIDLSADPTVITYCGGGYFGSFDLLMLYLMGYENAALYDGSWVEWSNSGSPIEASSTET